MKLELDQAGDFVLDPSFLAMRLATAPGELRRRMRLGLVTSLVERGTEGDEGSKRLTVRSGNVVWRGVVDADNHIISEEVLDLRQPALAKGS